MFNKDVYDWCHECNTTTLWNGEICSRCGRQWGYELGDGPDEEHARDWFFTWGALASITGRWAVWLAAVLAIVLVLGRIAGL